MDRRRIIQLSLRLPAFLLFTGIKMALLDVFHILVGISLGVIASILIITLLINTRVNRRNDLNNTRKS